MWMIGAGLLALGAGVWVLDGTLGVAIDAGAHIGPDARHRVGVYFLLALGCGVGLVLAAGALIERGI